MLPNTDAVNFCDTFSDIGQCFRPAQTKSLKNQKLAHVWIVYGVSSKYLRPLNKLKQTVGALQTVEKIHNSKITDRQTDIGVV